MAIFVMPFTSWIAFPMLMILMPIPTAWLSGGWLMRYKRNKPDHYLGQRVSLLRAALLTHQEHKGVLPLATTVLSPKHVPGNSGEHVIRGRYESFS